MFDIEKVKKMSECELQELLASLDATQDLDALAFCLAEIASVVAGAKARVFAAVL